MQNLRRKRLKFFLKRGSCELIFKLFCLKWDPCKLQEKHEKRGFQGAHPHTFFLGQCLSPGLKEVTNYIFRVIQFT